MQKQIELPFFRAKRDGRGTMLTCQLREQNAFMQTGAQAGSMHQNGGAPFELKDPKRSITVKLGIPDLGSFLAAYRAVRISNGLVPLKLRAYSSDAKRDTTMSMSLVHKYLEQSKVLSWTFTDEGSFLGLSHGQLRQSVALSPGDEVAFAKFCELALERLMERAAYVKNAPEFDAFDES